MKSAFTYPARHCEYGEIMDCEHYPATPLLSEQSSQGYRFRNSPPSAQNSDDIKTSVDAPVPLTLANGAGRKLRPAV